MYTVHNRSILVVVNVDLCTSRVDSEMEKDGTLERNVKRKISLHKKALLWLSNNKFFLSVQCTVYIINVWLKILIFWNSKFIDRMPTRYYYQGNMFFIRFFKRNISLQLFQAEQFIQKFDKKSQFIEFWLKSISRIVRIHWIREKLGIWLNFPSMSDRLPKKWNKSSRAMPNGHQFQTIEIEQKNILQVIAHMVNEIGERMFVRQSSSSFI